MEELQNYIDKIENELFSFFSYEESRQKKVIDAARYSLEAGGKRIRPVLTLAFCKMCGGNIEKALPVACAIEYMHTFSLIHDDLPCMDNDDFRRGKPSCHKAFDEYTALLAGDALAIKPFEIISEAAINGKISYEAAAKCSFCLSKYVGTEGMIGGQQIDTDSNGIIEDCDEILSMYSMKTSDLLKAACCCGVICAESENESFYLDKAKIFAHNLGLAFQIIDDILDMTSTTEILGKPVGSDLKSEKHTYASVAGIDNAAAKAAELTKTAISTLDNFPENEFVKELTLLLLDRKK